MPPREVGAHVRVKHGLLRLYIAISAGVRHKYRERVYVDLMCGPPRARIRETDELVPGSALVAWRASREGRGRTHAPFTKVLIADHDEAARRATAAALRAEGAPVIELRANATEAAREAASMLSRDAFTLCFIDPYSLSALEFAVFEALSRLRFLDILVHVSAMDLRRNERELARDSARLERIAPGWDPAMAASLPSRERRYRFLQHWWGRITGLMESESSMDRWRLVRDSGARPLYWLAFCSRASIADRFWTEAQRYIDEPSQPDLFD